MKLIPFHIFKTHTHFYSNERIRSIFVFPEGKR